VSLLEAQSAREAVSWGRAGALPQADASASYTETLNDTRQERINTPAESRNGAKSSSSAAGVTGTWTVFEGLASLAAYDRLKSTAALADERREQTRQDVAAGVTLAYVGIVRERTVLAALDSSVALSRERVKLTQGKYGFGGVSKLELLQAQLDLNEDLSGRLRQALVLGNAKRNLNLLLAREDTVAFEVEDSIALVEPPPFEGLRIAAIEGSPAIRQARLTQAVASAGLREYVGRLFPKVGLTLGYNYGLMESEVGLVRSNEALGLSYGVNVKMNLFDGFTLPADYRSARRSVARSRLLLDEVRDQVDASLAEAHAGYQASLDILGLETSNLALARENLSIAMERLRLGTIASLELREAQEKYLSAETRLVSARFESKRSETELLRLSGRLARQNP
ncbi:MAG: TolC family protein, partial [Fibrobacterota bacterium]|nr:TolC family protein [Fibrobacterota bacterium]